MSTLLRPPGFRTLESGHHSSVTWTELFYDLVFVIAVALIGRRFVDHPSFERAFEYVALFGMIWWAWVSVTFLVDRFDSDDAIERLLAVIQMSGIAGVAGSVAAETDSFASIAPAIAASYTVTRLVLLAMYGRVWWHLEGSRPLVGGYLKGFSLDTLLWAASIFVPSPWRYVLWAVAMVISVGTPWLLRSVQMRSPLSTSHLPERFGLFTILVLGESVAAVVASLQEQHGSAAVISAAAGMVVATMLWWVYFDNLDGSVVRRDPNRRHDFRPTAWIYSHFPLALFLVMLGAGMAHLPAAHDHDMERDLAVVCGIGLAGALVALAVILANSAGPNHDRNLRCAWARGVGAVAVIAATFFSDQVSSTAYLSILAGIMLAEGLFDLAQQTFRSEPLDLEAGAEA